MRPQIALPREEIVDSRQGYVLLLEARWASDLGKRLESRTRTMGGNASIVAAATFVLLKP